MRVTPHTIIRSGRRFSIKPKKDISFELRKSTHSGDFRGTLHPDTLECSCRTQRNSRFSRLSSSVVSCPASERSNFRNVESSCLCVIQQQLNAIRGCEIRHILRHFLLSAIFTPSTQMRFFQGQVPFAKKCPRFHSPCQSRA